MALAARRLFRFGPFRLDADRRLLLRGREAVPLRPLVFDTLLVLTERVGEVVTKDELLDAVWPDSVVEENNLSQNILALRRVLEDGGSNDVRIETLPKRGYRLIAQLEEELPPPRPTLTAPTVPRAIAAAAPRRRPMPMGAVAVLVGAVVVALGLWLARRGPAPSEQLARIQSIAVLPFRSIVQRPEDEFLGLALADSVITRLSRASNLVVRPTSAVRGLPQPSPDPVAAARALRVDAVLDGEIQELGDRVRVTLQLVGVGGQRPLWSESFDAPRANLFELEDSVADGVARGLAPGRGDARSPAARRVPSPEAYEAYLRGRYYWNKRTFDATGKSRELFLKSIFADREFAPAWAGLANAQNLAGQAPEAKASAQRALELDSELAEAHAALGSVALFYDFDVQAAERSFQRAIHLDPSYATAHQWYAFALAASRRFDEAVARIRKAHELDPLSLSIATDVGNILFLAGRYDEAEREVRQALDMDEHFAQAHLMLGLIRLQQGDIAGAEREYSAGGWSGIDAIAEARAGHKERAWALLDAPVEGRAERSKMWRAQVRLELGEPERALDELELAVAEHTGDAILLSADPRFASLRGNPRFTELLRRLQLPVTAAGTS